MPEGDTPIIQTTTYAYDPQTGALSSVTDAARTTTYHYDNRGLVDLVTYSDGKSESTTCDANGNPTQVTDRSGRTLAYEYNRYNEVTAVKFGETTVASYTYDDLGRVTSEAGGELSRTNHYDAQGRLEHATQVIKGRMYDLWYAYGDHNRVTGLTLKDAQGAVLTQLAYGYAPPKTTVSALVNGTLQQFGEATVGTGGRLAGLGLGNGIMQSYDYDNRKRLESTTSSGPAGGVLTHAYTYGTAGNITGIDTQAYGYDKRGRLTSATGGLADLGYTYDDLGNRTQEVKGGSTTAYTYENGLLTQAGSNSYTYHPDGSLATKTEGAGNWAYNWDGLGRLTSVQKNGASIGTYGYDSGGLRVWKDENGQTTLYIREGNEVLYEEVFSGTVEAGSVPTATRAFVDLNGETVGVVVDGIEPHYYLNDHLGTTEIVTDGESRVAENIRHTPFSDLTHVVATEYQRLAASDPDWIDQRRPPHR